MSKEIEIDGCIVKYDINQLKEDSKNIYGGDYDEEYDDGDGLGDNYRQSKKDFDLLRKEFHESVNQLESLLSRKISGKLTFTKKGNLDKRKSIVILESGIITDYSNEYGSHNYKEPTILAYTTGDKELTIYYHNRSQQDSF